MTGLPSQSRMCSTDSPFCRFATSSPGAGEVFPQRESPWQNQKLCVDCQSLSLWERWHCVSNDGEGEDADGIRKKPIDKSHKKRYILFINALKKSVHCICRSESRRMLRIRYGRAVRCHFGAGAVNRKASRSRSCPTLPGHQGAQNVLRNLGGTAVCNVTAVPWNVPWDGFFRPTSSFFTGRTL